LVARGGAGPLPGGNKGVRAPKASWRDRPIGVWLPHVAAPDPLGLWTPSPSTLYELRGEVRRPWSQLPGPDRTSRLPEDKNVGLENPVSTRVDSLSDDFLAGWARGVENLLVADYNGLLAVE
jgi:hypothetical protein